MRPGSVEHALALMEQLAQKNAGLERARREPVAIVGMGCRFPGGAGGPEAFWKLLEEGRDAVRSLDGRWAWLGVPPPDAPGWAGLLSEEEVSEFDAGFFEISDREARSLDPQQRLVLSVAWEALENAGISPRSLVGSATAVYVGSTGGEYQRFGERVPEGERDAYFATGAMASGLAGRLSYVLGLQGPAVTLDTACSSSLVATHLACQSLRAQECHLAIAGGVNLILSPEVMTGIALTRTLSPDGRCRTFDARANGFVRGEGCGVLVLKRLSDAQRDGDRIWAVVRGSAVNQDGKSTGLTAPNVLAQQRLLRDALGAARVDPAQVDFVETHGTGTALGDPIELEALRAVMGAPRAGGAKCLLGAVKTQIGHLEAAAGVAGIMKAALALQHRMLPGNLGFQALNPLIRLEGTPLAVADRAMPLPRPGRPLLAGVSAFGLSGTNAHVVVEEAPAAQVREVAAPTHAVPVLLSARTPEALSLQAGRLRAHLEAHPEISLLDAAHTLAVARAHFEERAVVVGKERAEVIEALGKLGPRAGAVRSVQDVAVLFPGSSDSPGSTRSLYERFEAFRSSFDAVCQLLPLVPEQALGAASEGALLAQQVALYRFCESWGLKVGAVLGTEVGEISAAHVAGALSLEDACRLAVARDRLARAVGDLGGAAQVELEASEEEVRSFVKGKEAVVAVAAVLGPRRTRVSGEAAAVREVEQLAETFGRRTWRVERQWEFHSRRAERAREALEQLERAGRAVSSKAPVLPIISGSVGAMVGAAQLAEAGYWARQARLPVRFGDAMRALEANGTALFLELGPSAALTALGPDCLGEAARARACFRSAAGADALVEAMAAFHARGAEIDWAVFFARLGGRRVELPPTPFMGRRHWFPAPAKEAVSPRAGPHPVLLERSESAETGAAVWTGRLDGAAQPWLAEHGVGGVAIFPAAASLELMGWAFTREAGAAGFELESVSAERPLVFEPGASRAVQVIVHREGGAASLALYSRPESGGGWTRHARAQARAMERSAETRPPESLREQMQSLPRAMEGAEFYTSWKARGNLWGPTFQGVERLRYGDSLCVARIRAGAATRSAGHMVHPALLDACGQALAVFALARPSGPFVGRSVGRCRLHAPLRGETFWSRIQLRRDSGRLLSGDVAVHGEDGELLLEVDGLEIELLHADPAADPRGWTYARKWVRAGAEGAELAGRWLFVGAEPELRAGLEVALGARASFAGRWQEPAAQAALADPELRGAVYVAPRAEGAAEVEHAASVLTEAVAPLAALRAPARLWWVTRGCWPTGTGAADAPLSQAALWGMGLSISVEHAARWGGLIDLPAGRDQAQALVRALGLGPSERQISAREDGPYVARLTRLHAPTEEPPTLSPGAAYVVTGGLGGLGAKVAEWLVDRGARHLVLMGRTGLPERRRWREPPGSKAAAAAATIRTLEARGAHVEVAAVNVSDTGALERWLERYRAEDRPPIRGVVHAAGVLEPSPAQELDAARLRRHLAPKLGGALALEHALTDQPLDFFICFSSASALVASPMLGEYAAANACLDAFAERRRAAGKPALSIAWGPWGDAGMLVDVSKQAGRAFQTMSTMGSAEALAVMGSLWRGPPCPAVLPIDWERWRTSYRSMLEDPFYAAFEDRRSPATPTAAEAPASSAEALEPLLTERLGELLERSAAIDPEESLVAMGMDSLMAYEAQGFIQERWGVEVPVMQFLKGGSVSALAGFIRQAIQAAPPPAAAREAGPERLEIAGSDGLRLTGHLSLPPGPGPHPAIVVHTANAGGALDEHGRYAQLLEHAPLVAAGFAVLTVDQRGSLGHGEEHFRKADLGGRDADDVIAAATALASRPDIDSSRLGLCGTSRGAYVGLLALERAPERFSAAVLRMGFYDPVAYVEGERRLRPETSPVLAMFPGWEQALAFMGAPDRDPRRHLSAVRAPLLLLHGEADRIVDPNQSRALATAARDLGLEVALRTVSGMGHDIQEAHASWPEIWKEIAEFLHRHLPMRPEKSALVPVQGADLPRSM